MKILVAGASGLVGTALKNYLAGLGHEVVSLSRGGQEGSVHWDPERGEINPEELEGFDAVVNLAGENIAGKRWSEGEKRRILESRVKATRLLADTLAHLARPPKVWINASAVGYYGSQGEKMLSEANGPGTGFLAGVCQAWEGATGAAAKKGIRVVLTRFGIVLSPKGGILGRLITPFKLGLGGKIGNGNQYMSWIAIEDLVAIIGHILVHDEIVGPLNVVSPHAVTNGEFTEELANTLHRSAFFTMPAAIARLVFGKEMAEEMLLASARVYPKRLLETEYVFQYPKLSGALQHLLT